MDRRLFLSSALSTAAVTRASHSPLGIAFLGGSHSHAGAKVRLTLKSPEWNVIGMWEDDPKVRERYKKGGRHAPDGIRFASRDELLADKNVQVVAVESGVQNHAHDALRALEAGKHVHLEKPPAVDIESFRRVVRLAEKKKLLLQMGYMWRFHPGINRILEAARKGWLGDVFLVRAVINTNVKPPSRHAMSRLHGGIMFELGAHVIDPIARLMGRADSVTPFIRRSGVHTDQLSDNTAAVLEYPGAMAIVSSASLQPNAHEHRSFEVLGTKGSAYLYPIERETRLEIDLAEQAGPYSAGRQEVNLPSYERYLGEFAEMLHSVRDSKPLSVNSREDLIVHETLVRASGMA